MVKLRDLDFFFLPVLKFDLKIPLQVVECVWKLLYFKSRFPDTLLVLLVLNQNGTFHNGKVPCYTEL